MARKKKFSLDNISDSNKEILFDILSKNGIETVQVSFDGGGDDGQIEDSDLPSDIAKIIVKGSKISQGKVWNKGEPEIRWKEDCTVEEIVDSICYQALELLYGGWENDSGAFGDFVFDVKDRVVALDFNDRFTDSNLYQHEF